MKVGARAAAAAVRDPLRALGPAVAVFYDRARNRRSLKPEVPGALMVAIAIPGFSVEAPAAKAKYRLSTFEG